MNNQTFMLASIVLCSLGGWYVVVTKYLALKQMIKNPKDEFSSHIPGMGPPPVSNVPFMVPHDMQHDSYMPPRANIPPSQQGAPQASPFQQPQKDTKREVCNTACILHLLGFGIISGVPFLNVILVSIFWLLKKEQHAFIAKQGREVINFHITFTIIQFLCLGGGVFFIRYMPQHAEKLFAFTKITRIVFSSGMYMPFNVFTVLPFFWCVIVMIRGSVAAYHGVSYKYPATQQFLFTNNTPQKPATPAQAPAQARL